MDGIQYAIVPKKTRGELVQLELNLHFGSDKSLFGLNSAARMLGEMLRRGTKTHNHQELNDALSKLGAKLSIGSDVGELSVSLQVKKGNLPAALKLLGEILREPSFPEAEFDILKRENLDRLNQFKTDPQAQAFQTMAHKLSPYSKDNVRYVPTIEEGIARISASSWTT